MLNNKSSKILKFDHIFQSNKQLNKFFLINLNFFYKTNNNYFLK